jgi:predicted metal-dependent phosphoesterase TrpH
MEISSLNGHIVALNIQEPIPRGLNVDETVDKIHEAGGIAIACHPITFFKGSLGKYANSKFDAIEVINSSAFPFRRSIKHAQRLASRLGSAQVAGTDAHYGPEIGYAYTLINAELAIDEVIKAIGKGSCRPCGKAIPWTLRLRKQLLMLKRRY